MPQKIYAFYKGKPYFGFAKKRNEIRMTVKRVALNFAMETGADMAEALDPATINTVTEMVIGGVA